MTAAFDRVAAVFAGRVRRRAPVVLQQDPTECAAACLAMILGAHGRATSLTECRALTNTGRDGATAHTIAEAARICGLVARGFSAPAGDLSAVALPAVAHWQFNHFVVVERFARTHVDVVDPAHGRMRLSRAEFDAGFTGVVLTFEPGPGFDAALGRRRFTRRAYLRSLLAAPGIRAGLAHVAIASLVLQLLGLALPVFTKIVVDDLVPHRMTSLVLVLALGMGVWLVAQALIGYVRSVLLLQIRTRLDAKVMLAFFEHLLSLPYRYFQTRTTGDLLMRLASNSVLREIFTNQTISVLLDGVLVVGYAALLLTIAPSLGAIALGVGALQALVLFATTPHTARLTQRDLHAQSRSQSYLVEALNGIATLKASGAEERALEHWRGRFHAELEASLARSHFSTITDTLLAALRVASPLLLLLIGARAVLAGEMTLGTMLALNALAAAFLAPLSSLLASAQNLQVVGAHLDRIADVLEAEPEQDPRSLGARADVGGRFSLENVSFRYAAASPNVLHHVTLEIQPGAKVALVGPTGSGKSTLGMLLIGLYSPTEGDVLIDGRPLRELDLAAMRRRFGVVLQDTSLFSGSIRDNIAFHDPAMSMADVIAAARTACIHDEIAAMPMAYETMLAEGGAGLSGGQRQRIALARALARRPGALLLDEATSHLDVATESRIDANLTRLLCTRIVIAHRLSTVRDADCIFVMDAGRIVDRGTHDELVAHGRAYADLVQHTIEG